jgi:hypothetical protein
MHVERCRGTLPSLSLSLYLSYTYLSLSLSLIHIFLSPLSLSPLSFYLSLDRYGFLCSDAFHHLHELPPAVLLARRAKEESRTAKWVKMIKAWEKYGPGGAKASTNKLKRRVRKGIPDSLRGLAWYRMSSAEHSRELYPDIEVIDTHIKPTSSML